MKYYKNELLDLGIPIIACFHSGEYRENSIFIRIMEIMLEKGYRTIAFSLDNINTDEYIYEMPIYIFYNTESVEYNIIAFNHYIYEKIKEDEPDIILFDVPSGILEVDRHIHNNFGLYAFMFSVAVEIDFAIMNLFFDQYTEDFFKELNLLFRYRFSVENVLYNLLDKRIDWVLSREKKQLIVMDANKSHCIEVLKRLDNESIYHLADEKELIRLINVIEARLLEDSVIDLIQ